MILKNNEADLNLVLKFKVENFDYTVFATSSNLKCFKCGQEAHRIVAATDAVGPGAVADATAGAVPPAATGGDGGCRCRGRPGGCCCLCHGVPGGACCSCRGVPGGCCCCRRRGVPIAGRCHGAPCACRGRGTLGCFGATGSYCVCGPPDFRGVPGMPTEYKCKSTSPI